jgi:uroporphyrinogen III methyltransferase/synthase
MFLKGKRILITRPKAQAQEFGRLIEAAGGEPILFPTVEIAPPESWVECDGAIRRAQTYDIFLFTSANAVEKFLDRVLTIDGRNLSTIRQKSVYAVGEKTRQALEAHGCSVTNIPETYTAEDLGAMLQKIELRQKKILFPHGNLGNHVLPKLLRRSGAAVDEVIVYRTEKPEIEVIKELQERLGRREIDVATFFSPSSVKNLLEMIPASLLNGVVIAVVGTVTEEAVNQLGLRVEIVPPTATAEAMVDAIEEYFQTKPTHVSS